ncbi:hypothetical protein Ddye_005462 [Dipteronia dyeriana]|uniref:Exo_endo_phos domain-containing protein n=1 Tax=Dipteronia dyeriana TaxID=168575 RepID=A0AAE0CPT0_9ROSI|nr:hypothetical protein Ddye_005462 [Dipteronia dyeriana]
MDLLSYSKDHIDIRIYQNKKRSWCFTGFYGDPDRTQRRLTWTLLSRLAGMSYLPWVCMGDFNEICFDNEKMKGLSKKWGDMADFREAIEDSQYEDIQSLH